MNAEPKAPTKKQALIARLNQLRASNNLPAYDPRKLTMTCEEIEGLIYHLETPSHNHKQAPTPATVAELLKKLNVLRGRAREKPFKLWKKSRDDLEKAIKLMELELVEEAMLKTKKGQTKIAEGADTKRSHTEAHKNPIQEDMKRMRARQERQKIREMRDTAKRIALWAGYSSANVFSYLEAKDTTRPTLAGDALKADIKAWLETRDKVLPRRRGKPPSAVRLLANDLASRSGEPPERLLGWLKQANISTLAALPKAWQSQFRAFLKSKPAPRPHGKRDSGSVTPHTIGEALSLDAKQVRMRLRKLEAKIPKGWRVPDERWGFKQEHKSDILKLVKP